MPPLLPEVYPAGAGLLLRTTGGGGISEEAMGAVIPLN